VASGRNLELIQVKEEGAISIIRMNRSEKRNALNKQMYDSLIEALNRADQSSNIHAILIHGGDQCFTSGNDLKDFALYAEKPALRRAIPFLKTISRVTKPVVAALNGVAVGIGVTMLLHCDLVFAGRSTRFQLPFINLGLCPEGASSYLLPRLSGHCIASEILLLGNPFSAETAHEIGLINKVLPDSEVFSHALSVAHQLVAKPLESILLTKSLLKRGQEQIVAETLLEEKRRFSERLMSDDFKKAFEAFYSR
jgi:enoyl-CoA hydratase/carnithine racemase